MAEPENRMPQKSIPRQRLKVTKKCQQTFAAVTTLQSSLRSSITPLKR